MSRPNILIFMTDQQQAQVTYTDHPCRTPHLDKMLSEGVRFDQAFTTMTHCCPSRASFMTGLYPSQHGIYNNVSNPAAIHRSLNEGVVTFSEKLKQSGYSLHFSGKWHVSGTENPSDRGWEELMVTASKDAVMGVTIEQWKNKTSEETCRPRGRGEIERPGWGNFKLYGVTDEPPEHNEDYLVVHKAIDRLEQLQNQSEPWCLYVGTFGPHDPFLIPEKYARMYDAKDVELPPNYRDTLEHKPAVYRRMRKVWDQLNEEEVRESIAYYWGYCSMVDDLFGEVLDTLERTNQAENTIVIFLSDHGESLGAHGLYLKGISPYDETYRIPCVVRWPGGIRNPGRQVDALVSIIDFAPMIMDLAQAGTMNGSRGMSLVPWLNDEVPLKWRDAVFTQCNGVEVYYSQRMVRTFKFKFVYNPTDVDELYDLEEDPFELNNLADREEMKGIKEHLLLRMWQEAAETEDIIFNQYPTVATAQIGPAIAIGKSVKEAD